MKKMLSVWLSLGLTVSTGFAVAHENESKNTNKYARYLMSMDDFLYLKTPKDFKSDNLSEIQIKKTIKEAFYNDSFGKEVYESINFEILNNSDNEVTVLFKDKKGSNLLKDKIILKFNIVLFNYDKINEFIYVIDNYANLNPLVLTKNHYIQMEIEDLLKDKFKVVFDTYANSVLYLNGINEFWEFVDFENIQDQVSNNITAIFLNNTKLNFKVVRDTVEFTGNDFDKYINFSVNEKIFKENIFRWIKTYSYFNENFKDCDKVFKIEHLDKNIVTISLSDILFKNPKLITLKKIK
ncbi:hypothetical protein [Spiroplasma sp. BIUS-1]|uniref:hypothetical protein n=1 Tax=Spiroplasma sp. BIUS-1 TaxID=216964 RepID=UPI00139785A2|nr:hypothetical protein [Spiroplasma sp. BIUS-1]QHX36902.1 hypothetical protein SBIUS_v1c06490 [Spiroplasma sp. BIUS-1]